MDKPMRKENISVPQAKSANMEFMEINGVANTNPMVIGRIHRIM